MGLFHELGLSLIPLNTTGAQWTVEKRFKEVFIDNERTVMRNFAIARLPNNTLS